MGAYIEYSGKGEPVQWAETDFTLPVPSDQIAVLLGQYRALKNKIEDVSRRMIDEGADILPYFLDGNATNRRFMTHTVTEMFKSDGAIAALNADFWSKALNLTDVIEVMPQARRDEWYSLIYDHKTPDFEEDTVRTTLETLLADRPRYFAERVEGVFRALSGDHVTNRPEGFSKRMIVARVVDEYGVVDSTMGGYINDLRCVIARFMGRDEPSWFTSSATIRLAAQTPGEWMSLDGNALRVKVYKVGTVHIEVHADMAWRLNEVLASLYPMAIPPSLRKKPTRKKAFSQIMTPLPFRVVNVLADILSRRLNDGVVTIPYSSVGSHKEIKAEVARVLEMIGGAVSGADGSVFRFDYDPTDAIRELVITGLVPEHKSHQFYPTTEKLARLATDLAGIDDHHTCLEPSAGNGGLARYMPEDATLCVELSALHCKVLEGMGFTTLNQDFLEFSGSTTRRFDRIVMNPPFSEGRAQLHLYAAASLIAPGGRLVAILPGSMKGKSLSGFDCEWHGPFEDQFQGTGVRVVILVANKQQTH